MTCQEVDEVMLTWSFLGSLTDIGSSSDHFTPVGLVIHGIILPGYIGMRISQYKGPYSKDS